MKSNLVILCLSNSVWDAARYLIPGLIGHESAMNGSQLMEVPDFGDPK